ncbi:hypothetical protein GCM10010833_03350 [Blastomonas aquatica]|uniref:ATP-binding protein n=1 Tax=Blastomonas aquatica TaxID=1510276 RepID=A0ABQ1IU65_9SPHN|nr:hypothetical protein GCM10010833_03350 [Blastomonas aquatica]
MTGRSLAERLAAMPAAAARRYINGMSDAAAMGLAHHWQFWARPGQIAPEGDWRIWLIMAGRGFGKTRAGAEWVRAIGEALPDARIALVAANLAEARSVMVEGQSGLLGIAPDATRPHWEPSLRRLRWPGGAQAMLYSAAEPESLRGPEHSHARCAGAKGNYPQRSVGIDRRAAQRMHRVEGFRSCDPGFGRGKGVDRR